MAISDYPPSAVPWPAALDWSAAELRGYLAAAADPAVQGLVTRCPPWTIRDLTAHLAVTFHRFANQLRDANAGDLTPPFGPGDLALENRSAVAVFAVTRSRSSSDRPAGFCAAPAARRPTSSWATSAARYRWACRSCGG